MLKKIALYHPNLNLRGGAERKLLLICQALLDKGHTVELYVHQYDSKATFCELIPPALKIEVIGAKNKSQWVLKITYLVLISKYDLFIASNYPANFPLLFLKLLKPRKKIAWICNEVAPLLHSPAPWWKKKLLCFEKWGCRLFNCVVANSSYTASEISNYYKVKPIVIYSGIQLPLPNNASGIRDTLKTIQTKPYLLILSRIEEHKNLELIPRLCVRFPELQIIVAGVGNSTSNLVNWQHKHQNLKYLGSITQEEKIHLYQNCLLFAFLPKKEPLGVTVIEAIGFNKPVVAFAGGGPLETIQNGINGFLNNTEEQYFESIEYILKNNFQIPREKGFDYVSSRFSVESMQQNFTQLFLNLS